MKKAVVIIEQRRPDCLWLCLHALKKVKGIEGWDIVVDIDAKRADGFEAVSGEFGIPFRMRETWSGGDLQQWTRALSDTLADGYDEFLYFEGDTLIRTDTLDYLNAAQKDQCFVSLNDRCPEAARQPGYPDGVYEGYTPLGNWINRENLIRLKDFIDNKRFVGKRLWKIYEGHENMTEHDRAFCFFCVHGGAKTRSAPMPYLFHFGVDKGLNNNSPELAGRIFEGPKSGWLSNLWRTRESSNDKGFTPEHFKYA